MEPSPIGICILCDEPLRPPIETIKSKGISTLIEASRKRKDAKHLKLRRFQTIHVHESCAQIYPQYRNKKQPRSSLQSNILTKPLFDFQKYCLFCKRDASDGFVASQKYIARDSRISITHVTNAETRRNIMEKMKGKKDPDSLDLLSRIACVEDLVAVGARYHKHCGRQFILSTLPKGADTEPPGCKPFHGAAHILRDSILSMAGGEKGKQRTGAASKDKTAKPDVVKSYEEKMVERAGLIIHEDIQALSKSHTKNYPTADEAINNLNNDSIVPESLKYMLTELLTPGKDPTGKSDIRVTAMAHAIMSAALPNFKSPLQLGLSAAIKRECQDNGESPKEVLDYLHDMGITASYEDTLAFEAVSLKDPSDAQRLSEAFLSLGTGDDDNGNKKKTKK